MILVIGDLHINQNRKKAIKLAFNEILSKIKNKKFSYTILLGDIFDKTPTIEERNIFAKFLSYLLKKSKKIILIKGTDSHEYTKGIYNLSDLCILNNKIEAKESFEIDNYVFLHTDIYGLKYSNGFICEEGLKKFDKEKTYIVGHFHTPQQKDNIIVVGSIYKTSFAEKDDEKMFLIVKDTTIDSISIKSRNMIELHVEGKNQKLKYDESLLNLSTNEVDLKIVAKVDKISLPPLHKFINRIKNKFNIEYYQEDITIEEIKTDVPKSLNSNELAKKYCKDKNIDYNLVKASL